MYYPPRPTVPCSINVWISRNLSELIPTFLSQFIATCSGLLRTFVIKSRIFSVKHIWQVVLYLRNVNKVQLCNTGSHCVYSEGLANMVISEYIISIYLLNSGLNSIFLESFSTTFLTEFIVNILNYTVFFST